MKATISIIIPEKGGSMMLVNNSNINDFLVTYNGTQSVLHRGESAKLLKLGKGETLSFAILTTYTY